MAQRMVLVDDIDGGEASETVVFALDGTTYEIDLNADNAGQLRDDLASWVSHARQSANASARRTTRRGVSRPSGNDNASIRAWARTAGHSVSDRGRIPAEIVDAYNAAH